MQARGQKNKAGILWDEKNDKKQKQARMGWEWHLGNCLGAQRLGRDEEAAWRARV